MATLFTEINSIFTRKISDYSFVNLTQTDLDNILKGYLESSIPKFKKCKTSLSDRTATQFNQTLTDEEKEILGILMIFEWLNPQILNIELLKQALSSKDWSAYSQANHLKELRILREDMQSESERMMTSYSYDNGKIEDLK